MNRNLLRAPKKLTRTLSTCNYQDLLNNCEDDYVKFWSDQANQRLDFVKPFSRVVDANFQKAEFRWFDDGVINAKQNCVDRHVDKTTPALIWERDEPGTHETWSYSKLAKKVHQIAFQLKELGVRRGSKVAIYMPTNPTSVAAILACAQLGAVHNVVFAGFSSNALAERCRDSDAKVLITTKHFTRGGKTVDIGKKVIESAVKSAGCIEHVLLDGDDWLENISDGVEYHKIKENSGENGREFCENEPMNSEDELFILYTSGSTGKPKGLVHTHAGYLLYAGITHQYIFDYQPGDIYACVADIGWITGHSYVIYGPLVNGATTVLFESTPTYPDASRYWEMVERLKINQLYTSPTAIRALYACGNHFVDKHDISSLKVLGTVGEPIGTDPWKWYNEVIGKGECPIADTWWQTETGGVVLTPHPKNTENEVIKPGFATHPFLGQKPWIDDKNDHLYLTQPWPGMARTIYGNHERFKETYYEKPEIGYFTGDLASVDEDGHYLIKGRADDVMNVSGKRLGTGEIEGVINTHDSVTESAVVAIPDKIKGEVPIAFVFANSEVSTEDLNELIKKEIASFAKPKKIVFTKNLPKTRSGKIMRRVLKKLALGEHDVKTLGDLSTLADSKSVERLIVDIQKSEQ